MRRTLPFLLIAATLTVYAAQPVRARHGMVVTRERHATSAGLRVLESGGNAVDAAIAVGFALAVTHPSAGNIGGGGFMLIRLADGRTTFIDFRERAPGRHRATCTWTLPAKLRRTAWSAIARRASRAPCADWNTHRRNMARSRGRNWCSRRWNWHPRGFRCHTDRHRAYATARAR